MIDSSSTLSGSKKSNLKEFSFCTLQQLKILIFMIYLNKSQPKKYLICK